MKTYNSNLVFTPFRKILVRSLASVGLAALCGSVGASPAAAADCQFAASTPLHIMAKVEPQLIIDATCDDPFYRQSAFVVTNTEQLTYQVPGGALIPYTQVTGNFPARTTPLPAGVANSPTLSAQNYVFRFPAAAFFQNRTMQVQHPTTGNTIVDNRTAFTNGALSVNHTNAGPTNAGWHFRHHAAATKWAKAYASQLYGTNAKIYSYYWGCSGGGQMATAAAEGSTGVWDGVQSECSPGRGNPAHSFQWPGIYQLGITAAHRAQIASVRLVGNGANGTDGLTDAEKATLTAGFTQEEKDALYEFLNAGFPLNQLGANQSLSPITGTNDIFQLDPTYEDDFWSKPGYAGANPPSWLSAAKMDGFATITAINRDANNVITSLQLDPATIPPVPDASVSVMGTTGQRFYVYSADGTTRARDLPFNNSGASGGLDGATLNRTTGVLTFPASSNSPVLVGALAVGGKIRVNNRFLLSAYFYPRHTIIAGYPQYDQYRNSDGTAKYPQRAFSNADVGEVRQLGFVSTGRPNAKLMLFQNLSDAAAWPQWYVGYVNMTNKAIGTTAANSTLRLYYQEQGGHGNGGVVAGTFQQSLQDLMAWAEQGVAPKPSSRYTIQLGQIVLAPEAAGRQGLQPVIGLTANGNVDRATVGVNQPVNLAVKLAMPPTGGKITHFSWTVAGAAEPATTLASPQPQVNVTRTLTFATPGSYVVRITVNGQRDGLAAPANQTSQQNFKEVRVVVQ